MVSTSEQMKYYEGEQTLRNKDYMTITRSDYKLYQSNRYVSEQLDLKNKRLELWEIDLSKREKSLLRSTHRVAFMMRWPFSTVNDATCRASKISLACRREAQHCRSLVSPP